MLDYSLQIGLSTSLIWYEFLTVAASKWYVIPSFITVASISQTIFEPDIFNVNLSHQVQ